MKRASPSVAFLLTLLAAPAPAPAAPELVGLSGASTDQVVLVGKGGEIFARQGRAWKRSAGGGVATTLVSARGFGDGDIWAMGETAPPYGFDGKVWSAAPIRLKGEGAMAQSGAHAVAIGRRVFVLSGGTWQQLPTVGPTSITSVWASGPKNALVTTTSGDVRRWNGSRWTTLSVRLEDGESLVRLFSDGPTTVYAAGDRGTLARVDASRTRVLAVDPRITGFVPRVGHAMPGGTLYLAGEGTLNGRTRWLVVRVLGDAVSLWDTLPTLSAGDEPVALLSGAGGALLVVSRQGVVHRRTAGGTWSTELVDGAPPPLGHHPENPPAQVPSTPPSAPPSAPPPSATPTKDPVRLWPIDLPFLRPRPTSRPTSRFSLPVPVARR